MGLKSEKYSENLKTFKDIKNCNGSTFSLKVLLTSQTPVNTLHITYTYVNFVFNEIVIIIKIY